MAQLAKISERPNPKQEADQLARRFGIEAAMEIASSKSVNAVTPSEDDHYRAVWRAAFALKQLHRRGLLNPEAYEL